MEIKRSTKSYLAGLKDGSNVFYNPLKLDHMSFFPNDDSTDSYNVGVATPITVMLISVFGSIFNPIFFIGYVPFLYKSIRWMRLKDEK